MTAEKHDPTDAEETGLPCHHGKAGVGSTSTARWLRREFVILLTGRRFDPYSGYAAVEAAVFPALSNEETLAAFASEFSTAFGQS